MTGALNMSLAYTKEFTATRHSQMLLGRDGNRTELTVYNLSSDEFVFLGLGDENTIFTERNSLPLAPGESYDASVAPLIAIFIMTNGPDVETVIYYATKAPAYVKGVLING